MPTITSRPLKQRQWKRAIGISLTVAVIVGASGYNIALWKAKQELQSEITKTSAYLDTYLAQPRRALRLMKLLAEKGTLNLASAQETGHELWKLATQFPDIGYFNYGLLNGEFIGVGRLDHNSEILVFESSDSEHFNELETRAISKNGTIGTRITTKPWADFRDDSWFKDPLGKPQFTWADIYNWTDEPSVMVIGSGIGIDKDGKPFGTAGVDLFVADIAEKLQQFTKKTDSVLAITETNGLLVATSTEQKTFTIAKNTVKRIHIRDSVTPELQPLAHLGISNRDQNSNSKIVDHIIFKAANWTDGMGLQLRILAYTPIAALQLGWVSLSLALAIGMFILLVAKSVKQ